MVFGGFLVWVVFDAVAFLGLVVFGLGMVSIFGGVVSVGFCAFGCCELLFLYWGVGWFGGLVFVAFLGFCRVLPGRTVANMQIFKFWGWAVYSSARNINASNFKFFEGSWFWCSSRLVFLLVFCSAFLTFSHIPTFWETVKPFIFCQTFFDIRLAIT